MKHPAANVELEALLKWDANELVATVANGVRRKLEQHGHSLILFGTGQLGRITLKNLAAVGKLPVAFADNNSALSDSEVGGVPVFLPQKALEQFPDSLFVVTVYTSGPVTRQLSAMGAASISFAELAWCYPTAFLPWGSVDLPKGMVAASESVHRAFDLWGDEHSRQEFVGQIAWRCSLDSGKLPSASALGEMYFPRDLFHLRDDEVFVDCGAFDGDSIRAFLQQKGDSFRSAIGLEPDPLNRERFEKWRATLPKAQAEKIRLLPFAVGERRETLSFDSQGTMASAAGTGKIEVQSIPLDEALSGETPTFIKMDVEGAEPAALRGVAEIIRKHEPILAICLYHAPEHLWEIPLLIHKLNSGYRLFLRRYCDECWETVCYAVPRHRGKTAGADFLSLSSA